MLARVLKYLVPTPILSCVRSDFRKAADRIEEIRKVGTPNDGLHTLFQAVKICQEDYFLMGCDNSCAARNHPNVPRDQLVEFLWFTGDDDLDSSNFGNCHSTKKGNRWIVESFMTDRPLKEYQSTPEEVAWHYLRVKQLRAAQIPQDQRIMMLKKEADLKPWENME